MFVLFVLTFCLFCVLFCLSLDFMRRPRPLEGDSEGWAPPARGPWFGIPTLPGVRSVGDGYPSRGRAKRSHEGTGSPRGEGHEGRGDVGCSDRVPRGEGVWVFDFDDTVPRGEGPTRGRGAHEGRRVTRGEVRSGVRTGSHERMVVGVLEGWFRASGFCVAGGRRLGEGRLNVFLFVCFSFGRHLVLF